MYKINRLFLPSSNPNHMSELTAMK